MHTRSKLTAVSIIIPFLYALYSILFKKYSSGLSSAFSGFCIIAFIIINNKFSLLKTGTYYAVIIFILLSVFAGRALDFYARIPFWDKLLHFSSGFIIVPIGKQIYSKINGSPENKLLLNSFSALLAVSVACMWEIYEFLCDEIFGTTAQNGSLIDTMWDIIAGTVSAIITLLASPILVNIKKCLKRYPNHKK